MLLRQDNNFFRRISLNISSQSDSSSTPTRYERFIIGPSTQEEARIIWITWAVLAGLVACFCLIVVIAVLSSRKARSNPFNLYVVFLTVPDIIFSGNCSITCAVNAAAGHYYSAAMCEWQSWYCVFGFTANAWLNGVIAAQLHRLACDSKRGHRYQPPKIKRVLLHVCGVYLYASFVASWTLIDFLPHEAKPGAGIACLPIEYNIASTLFFWLVFFPLFFGIPFAYVLYVCYKVHRGNLLPTSGRTRQLYFFFMRLTIVFVLMWIPSFLIMFAIGNPNVWLSFAGGSWSHIQGFVSAFFCLTKPDIRAVVIDFLLCRKRTDDTMSEMGFVNSARRRSMAFLRRSSAFMSATRSSKSRNSRKDEENCEYEIPKSVFDAYTSSAFEIEGEHSCPLELHSELNTKSESSVRQDDSPSTKEFIKKADSDNLDVEDNDTSVGNLSVAVAPEVQRDELYSSSSKDMVTRLAQGMVHQEENEKAPEILDRLDNLSIRKETERDQNTSHN